MKLIDRSALISLSAEAAARPRRRLNRNLHEQLSDPIQRLLNAVEPGSYVRPHVHDDGRWELFAILSGRLLLLTFTPEGEVLERIILDPAGTLAVEIEGGTWHSIVALEPGTVVLEFKPGPYVPADDKSFAPWAPAEGDPAAPALQHWMATAGPDQRWG